MAGIRMKRSALKRMASRSKYAARRARRRLRLPVGQLTLSRKCAEQNIYNTAVAGTVAASGSVVVVGTPYQTPAFAGSAYYNVPFSIDTNLNDLLNAADLTQIADKYKINWVKIKVYCTSNTASSGGASQLPSMLWSIDEDDAAVPASSTVGLNVLREKMSTKYRAFKQNGGGLTIFYKPRVSQSLIGAAGTAVSGGIKTAGWIDCNSPDIPHYGVKGYLQDVNLAVTPGVYTQFKFDVTMSVSLKDIQ